jgi:hypothetical protein
MKNFVSKVLVVLVFLMFLPTMIQAQVASNTEYER